MKKVFFLIAFVLLTFGNRAVVTVITNDVYDNVTMPVGGNSEENSEEEHKSMSEEDGDKLAVDHRWLSQELSADSDLHVVYQEILFNNLEIEVVVPPPKG
jgi:hypothetical protein